MLNLSTIKSLSHHIVSPVKAVRSAIKAMTPTIGRLEKSPIQDTLVKMNPQNYILGSNPKKMIQELTSKVSSSFGKDASVFEIPNQENLILRVEHSAIKKMDTLADDLKLIPIKHSEKALAHDNLGLPLYSVVGKDSELFARESISPKEALAQKDNIMVLRKVTGKHPVSEIMKKGGTQTIPENHFFDGSQEIVFTNCETFTENYKNYVDSFLSYLKKVSKMPKNAYK